MSGRTAVKPQQQDTRAYHLRELQLALDSTDPKHCNPPPIAPEQRVLDIGCGAGQTLIAACPGRLSFGLDINLEALRLGRTLTKKVAFVCSSAEETPFGAASFDVILARVSLPYSNLYRSLKEIRRLLRPGGYAWMVLHPFGVPWAAARKANWKGWLFFLYIVVNSICFHLTGRMVPFVDGRHESFQTVSGMRRALRKAGFREISVAKGAHFVVSAS